MTADELWQRFRASGDPAALGAVFDAVSPELFRIALSLAPDAASAEDALQETWLVALKSASRHDATRPVVPWLAGILRKKVHEARRRGRRPDESRVARRAPPDDPALAAQSADEVARLRAAIDALPASQRAVAVLRWRYGLEPAEIADARGIPPGTVRSLLHRALARIRRRMKAAPALLALGVPWPRGLGDVRAVVLRAARRPSLLDATLASAGGVVMAKATKTAVIAAVACLLLGASAAVQFAGRRAPAHATSAGEESPTASHASPRVRTGAPGDAPTAPAADDAKPFARGIVVDEADAPVAGCRVLVRGHEKHGDLDVQEAPVRLGAAAAAITGQDGRFVVPKKPEDLASLTFVADGFEAVEMRRFDADLRVVLAKCESFSARVVDTAGAPIAGAEARVLGAWDRSGPTAICVWLLAATGEDGRFVFRSLPREARLTWISAPGRKVRGQITAALPVQDEYVLERTSLIVHVRDAVSHAPLDGARPARRGGRNARGHRQAARRADQYAGRARHALLVVQRTPRRPDRCSPRVCTRPEDRVAAADDPRRRRAAGTHGGPRGGRGGRGALRPRRRRRGRARRGAVRAAWNDVLGRPVDAGCRGRASRRGRLVRHRQPATRDLPPHRHEGRRGADRARRHRARHVA